MGFSLCVLAFAAAVDGPTVLRHASALAALGPHPAGSPRTRFAAEYVASQLRDVGVGEVQVQAFSGAGVPGANVIGVLRAPGREFLVIAAHHDTGPASPGAHEAGAGPGLLIELGRVFARDAARPRTLVFASFDGGASASARGSGAVAYLATLGSQAPDLVAAVVLGGVGWKGGAPVVHTDAHPAGPSAAPFAVAPAWLARVALDGASRGEAPLAVGDPGLFSWLYQPAARTFRRTPVDAGATAFAKGGVATLLIDDVPTLTRYPWRDQAADTADKLDVEALAQAGRSALGALRAIVQAPRGPAAEPVWFAAFGRVFGAGVLAVLGVLSLAPTVVAGARSAGLGRIARVAQVVLFGVLFWRHPLPALTVFLLPNIASAVGSRVVSILALAGALALAVTGLLGWRQGFVKGTWLEPWEIALFVLALAATVVPSQPLPAKGRGATPSPRPKGLPKAARRRSRGR